MQILKDKNILKEYILPVLLFPICYIIFNYFVSLIFQIGKYYGTFFRGLFELVIKNV